MNLAGTQCCTLRRDTAQLSKGRLPKLLASLYKTTDTVVYKAGLEASIWPIYFNLLTMDFTPVYLLVFQGNLW